MTDNKLSNDINSPQPTVEPSAPLTPPSPVPREPPPPYPGVPRLVPRSSTFSSSGWDHLDHHDRYVSPFVPDDHFAGNNAVLANQTVAHVIRLDDLNDSGRRLVTLVL